MTTNATRSTEKLAAPKRPAFDPKKNAPPKGLSAEAVELTDLVVWSVPLVNRRLLICHAPELDGANPMNLVNVTVRDNSLFLKKMTLRARRVNDHKFDLHGPLPRRRGHW
jgi:hypothetical protein